MALIQSLLHTAPKCAGQPVVAEQHVAEGAPHQAESDEDDSAVQVATVDSFQVEFLANLSQL